MIKGATTVALALSLALPASAAAAQSFDSDPFAAVAAGNTFTNPASMSGLAAPTYPGPHAKWNPYPSVIDVSGLSGTVSQVTVRLNDWYQGDTSYVDALLESPDGRRVMLISDSGTYSGMTQAAHHVNVVFDQTSPFSAPPRTGPGSGPLGPADATVFLRPTNHASVYNDYFPDLPPSAADAPADLGVLAGTPPNGAWKLYLTFAYAGGPQTGTVNGGWSLDIATKQPPPDTTAPRVTRVTTDDTVFRAAKRGGSIGRRGALIGFRLSEVARVSFDVDRLIPGRRVGDRCKAPTKRRKGKRCTRARGIPGSFTYRGKVGDNTFRFSGRMNGKALKPGRYRLTGLARDIVGNTARPFSVKVTIKKPRKPRARRR